MGTPPDTHSGMGLSSGPGAGLSAGGRFTDPEVAGWVVFVGVAMSLKRRQYWGGICGEGALTVIRVDCGVVIRPDVDHIDDRRLFDGPAVQWLNYSLGLMYDKYILHATQIKRHHLHSHGYHDISHLEVHRAKSKINQSRTRRDIMMRFVTHIRRRPWECTIHVL